MYKRNARREKPFFFFLGSQDGKERVISYYSHAFSTEKRNYCVTRRELLAVVIALKHFEPYLLFQKVMGFFSVKRYKGSAMSEKFWMKDAW